MVKNKGRKVAKKSRHRRLTTLERGIAIGMSTSGDDNYTIANTLNCTPKAIRELKKKVNDTKSLDDRPRSGRPKKTSPREDRAIKFTSLQDRFLPATKMAKRIVPTIVKNKLSVTTVRKRLRDVGLNGRMPRKKPKLSKKNITARYEWAKEHLECTEADWKTVIYSDESPFTLFQWSGRRYVRRRVGEDLLPQCTTPTVKHGGGKIQVWGCFSWNGAGPLYRVKGIMDGKQYREILKRHMAPYLKQIEEELKCEITFQHDNDPKHKSKIVNNYLENKQIVVLKWVSQSPDMNPIEHAWKHLKEKITDRADKAKNLDDVFEIAKDEWNKLPVEFFRNLISSMPNRVRALYEARGRATKY